MANSMLLEDGVVFVASLSNDRIEILSENDMEQSVIGSPVPMDMTAHSR